jgi:Rhs family protein
VQDPELRTKGFAYTADDHIAAVTDAANNQEEFRTFVSGSKIATDKDARNNQSSFGYDAKNRLNKITYPDSTYEEWTFDNNGNITTFRNRKAQNTVFTYDNLNRILTKAPAGQATVTYTYDLAGRMLTATTTVVSGNPSTGTFSRGYDSAGRLISETNPQGQVMTYQLDANGNVTRVTYPSSYYVQYEFDQLDRLTGIKLNGAGTYAATFTYDSLNRRQTKTYSNGNTVSYGYDMGDNLTSRSMTVLGGTVNWTYTYNKVHQMLTQSVSDPSYQWRPSGTSTVTYAAANSRNQYPTVGGINYTYDNNGSLTNDGVWTFGYNAENMLVSANKTGTSVSFVYDPFKRQTQKTVGTTKTKYNYSGSRLMEEYNGANNTLLKRYIYGGAEEILLEVASNGTVTYLHHDHLGSVIARADAAGAVGANKYTYSPFGQSLNITGSIGYTGQRYDSETGLYCYKARYYSPNINRFLQADPNGYGSGMNLYSYVSNDPVNHFDTQGLEEIPMWVKVLGSAYPAIDFATRQAVPDLPSLATQLSQKRSLAQNMQTAGEQIANKYGGKIVSSLGKRLKGIANNVSISSSRGGSNSLSLHGNDTANANEQIMYQVKGGAVPKGGIGPVDQNTVLYTGVAGGDQIKIRPEQSVARIKADNIKNGVEYQVRAGQGYDVVAHQPPGPGARGKILDQEKNSTWHLQAIGESVFNERP